MKIVFGWHLDGPTCPEAPDGSAFSIDAAVAGPMELLNLIETRLGLNGPGTPPAVRIAQYLARLRAIDHGGRFFSRSLAADGWATARLVLGWRDELVAAGWSPGSTSWQSARLAGMAQAEAQQDQPLAAGLPDRARSVIARIQGAGPVEDLTLVDDHAQLPFIWRRLIEALADAGANVVRAAPPRRGRDNDLARVQALLSDGDSSPLTGDRSFAVVRCDNELVAADIAAEWLAALPAANQDVAIIRQGDGTILDAACRRLGLPRPGGSTRSPFRGALQSLPLAFETAWQPLDAARVLELLVMRGSPVPYRVGRHFADVLRLSPGTGGADWQAAWRKATEQFRADHADDGMDGAELDRYVRKSLADWREWLEPDRFHREAGMAAKAADAICRKVQRWAQRRASTRGDAVYRQTMIAAGALADALAASGIDLISKPQLDRMIDAVVAEGMTRPQTIAESASWTTVDEPAQIWHRVPAVLWWGFSGPGTVPARSPWTDAERAELAAADVGLVPPGTAIARDLDAQRRALLGATQRILLITPALTAAETTVPHPLWHEISRLDGLGTAITDGRSLRHAGNAALCGRDWDLAPVAYRALPGPIRDWSVARQLIGARDRESATSLESLLGCPLNWVLQYHARLRMSGLLDMADGNQLKGNVAHEVLARFLDGPLPDDQAAIRRNVAALLDEMLPEIGSPLLLPGRLRDRDDLRRNTIESAVALAEILQGSGLSVAATERRLACALDNRSELVGAIDLELATADGKPAVVDLKWSNRDRYRRAEIEEARPVQLATYARLLNGDRPGAFPPGGYFMIKQHRLLAVDADPFPPQLHVEGSDLASVWRAVVEVRERVLRELESGRVVARGVELEDAGAREEASESAEAPIDVAPPCGFCSYGRLCGVRALS